MIYTAALKIAERLRLIGGDPVPMPEEQDFLDFLGLGWIEPSARKAGWRRA